MKIVLLLLFLFQVHAGASIQCYEKFRELTTQAERARITQRATDDNLREVAIILELGLLNPGLDHAISEGVAQQLQIGLGRRLETITIRPSSSEDLRMSIDRMARSEMTIRAIVILSHGAAGEIGIGTTRGNVEIVSINIIAAILGRLSNKFARDIGIIFHGCNAIEENPEQDLASLRSGMNLQTGMIYANTTAGWGGGEILNAPITRSFDYGLLTGITHLFANKLLPFVFPIHALVKNRGFVSVSDQSSQCTRPTHRFNAEAMLYHQQQQRMIRTPSLADEERQQRIEQIPFAPQGSIPGGGTVIEY